MGQSYTFYLVCFRATIFWKFSFIEDSTYINSVNYVYLNANVLLLILIIVTLSRNSQKRIVFWFVSRQWYKDGEDARHQCFNVGEQIVNGRLSVSQKILRQRQSYLLQYINYILLLNVMLYYLYLFNIIHSGHVSSKSEQV